MSVRPPVTQPMTIDEFLVWRGEEDMLWELVEGYPVLRDGPTGMTSRSHGRLLPNLSVAIANRLRAAGKPCAPESGGDLRIAPQGNLRLPDLLVRCGADELTADRPVLAIEILSPSNTASEMARKRADYMAMGIEEVAEVEQDRPEVWIYRPVGDVLSVEIVRGLDGFVTLKSVGIEIPMSEIYRAIPFPARTSDS